MAIRERHGKRRDEIAKVIQDMSYNRRNKETPWPIGDKRYVFLYLRQQRAPPVSI